VVFLAGVGLTFLLVSSILLQKEKWRMQGAIA
jgi:hypothetical protein